MAAPCALLFLVPSHLNMLLQALRVVGGPWNLRHVVCCGEPLLPSTVNQFYDVVASRRASTQLHNVYGPTEASMTQHLCEPGSTEVLIGEPIDNTAVWLLDEAQCLAPVGTPAGERQRDRLFTTAHPASPTEASLPLPMLASLPPTVMPSLPPSVLWQSFALEGSWRRATWRSLSSAQRASCPTHCWTSRAAAAASYKRSGFRPLRFMAIRRCLMRYGWLLEGLKLPCLIILCAAAT